MNSQPPISGGPQSGETLGRYRLLFPVGQGGMGKVWAAVQVGSGLRRVVAVKTAITAHGQTPEFQRLFFDEARIASLINHPNVCGVYELGEDRGVLYLVMEWCDGATMRDIMDRLPSGRMAAPVCARIVANVAAGLHAAHELEDTDGTPLHVVHRDVSPQNVLISKDGHVKVADFGVAKSRGQLHRPTETGEMKGKLAYMAPEQVTAKEVDRRADIFALGCVLYEATTGVRPFHGEGALSTLYKLLEQTVTPPHDLAPDYPPELSRIVLKALAKRVDDRYATAEEMRIELEAWLAADPARNAGERNIAELVKATVGEAVAGKNSRLTESIQRLDAAPGPVDLPASPSGPQLSGAIGAATQGQGPPEVEQGTEHGLSRPVPPKSGSRWWPAAVAVTAVAVAVALTQRWTTRSEEPVVALQAVPVPAASSVSVPLEVKPPDTTEPPEPQLVEVAISSLAPNAELKVDGGLSRPLPQTLRLRADAAEHRLLISAPGHVSVERVVRFDRDQSISVALELVPKLQRPAAPSPRTNRPSPGTSQTSPPESGTPGQQGPRRPPARSLDSSNPFAN